VTRDPRVYIEQIADAIERIRRYTSEGKDRFVADSMIQDAVFRNLEVIGEATKRTRGVPRCPQPIEPRSYRGRLNGRRRSRARQTHRGRAGDIASSGPSSWPVSSRSTSTVVLTAAAR